MTHAKQKSNKILLQNNNNNKIMIRKHIQIMYNKLKVMGNYISIYTHWAPSLKKIQKNLNLYVAHVHPCVPMCEF
jgi:hypothetical protein